MADATHYFGNDLAVGPTGDLAVSLGADETRERILRRLLTAPGAYLWHLDYGAGIGRMVGEPTDTARIQGVIASQVLREEAVARDPIPTVTVAADGSGQVVATISYQDRDAGPQTLAVPVAGAGG